MAASKELALHTQDLVDVMSELDGWNDSRFQQAYKMANRGSLFQLNEANLQEHRGLIFSKSIWETPMLTGREDLPLTDLPTPAQTQRIMTLELGGSNQYRFAPSRGTPVLDDQATKKLLDNITNPTYSERGAIIHAECPTLSHLRAQTSACQNEGLLGQTDFEVSIAPASEFFEISVYGYHRFTTLLSGTQVIFAYPPSQANTTALQARFQALSGQNFGPIWSTLDLEHGIAIVQKPGQTLMLPPFWPYVVFCTETCVSAAYSIATASKFTLRIEHVDLSMAQIQMWHDDTIRQVELVKFADSLAAHLELVLNEKLSRFDNKAVVIDVCKKWDRESKFKLGRVLAAIDDEGERVRILGSVTRTWIDLVHSKRDKKPICRLCKERLEKVKGLKGPDDNLVEHVTRVHGIVLPE